MYVYNLLKMYIDYVEKLNSIQCKSTQLEYMVTEPLISCVLTVL